MTDYDPAKDAHDSYFAAIEAKRARGDRTGSPRGSKGVPALYRSGKQSRAVSSPGLRKEKAVRAAEEKKPDCAMET